MDLEVFEAASKYARAQRANIDENKYVDMNCTLFTIIGLEARNGYAPHLIPIPNFA